MSSYLVIKMFCLKYERSKANNTERTLKMKIILTPRYKSPPNQKNQFILINLKFKAVLKVWIQKISNSNFKILIKKPFSFRN